MQNVACIGICTPRDPLLSVYYYYFNKFRKIPGFRIPEIFLKKSRDFHFVPGLEILAASNGDFYTSGIDAKLERVKPFYLFHINKSS